MQAVSGREIYGMAMSFTNMAQLNAKTPGLITGRAFKYLRYFLKYKSVS